MKNEREESKTELICETDAYVFQTKSSVLNVSANEEGKALLELDRTVFFPEGGGQRADEGWLGGFKVIDVKRSEGRVLHVLECTPEEFAAAGFAIGQPLTGEVDSHLRFARMQMHIAEHLFCGIAFRDFGYDNVGFHLSDVVTFDLGGPLTGEDVARIEEECNRVVWKNVPVKVHFPSPDEVGSLEFRSKLELTEGVRLVEIEGYDLCACCAPALCTTGEIGAVKVIDTMPHRGGTRITLIAGEKAYKDYVMLHEEEAKMMKIFSSVRGESADAAGNFCEKNAALHEENKALKRQITKLLISSLLNTQKNYADALKNGRDADAEELIPNVTAMNNESVMIGNGMMVAFYPEIDEVQSREIINECVKSYDGVVGIFRAGDDGGYRYVFGIKTPSPACPLKELAAKMRETLGGRGGGSDVMIQGSVPAKEEDIRRFFNETGFAL
ncbi:MAG: hypothetical protein IJH82_04975 [Lachnospiraceae bacterium]|nr:hypothetical protein [Lachnospiraceae bacterium]